MRRRLTVLSAIALAVFAVADDSEAQARNRRYGYDRSGQSGNPVFQWQDEARNFVAETFRRGDEEACRIHAGLGDRTEYNCIHYGMPGAPAYARDSYDYSRNYGTNYGPYYMGQRHPWGDSRYSWNRNYAPGPGYDTPDRGHHQATQNNVNAGIAVGIANLGYNIIHDTIQDRRTNRRLDEIGRKLDRQNTATDEIDRRYGLVNRQAPPEKPETIVLVNLTGCNVKAGQVVLADRQSLRIQRGSRIQVENEGCDSRFEELGDDALAIRCVR